MQSATRHLHFYSRLTCALAMFSVLACGASARAALEFYTVQGYGGVPLTVVQTGNKQGPPILFIHGFSQSYLSWKDQLSDPDLQSHFHLIALDLRGHGAVGETARPGSLHVRGLGRGYRVSNCRDR